MRIKEVEERTGLTAKAIRLYESKGLLKPARESENAYRDYSEEDVERLGTIAFLRDLDIPIKEIKAWSDGSVTLREMLHCRAYQAEDEKHTAGLRSALARELALQMEKDPDLDWKDAMEKAQLASAMYEAICEKCREDDRDLSGHIQATIVALCALGVTVALILSGSTLGALLSLIPTIGGVAGATYCWMVYARVPKKDRDRSGCLPMVAAVGVFVIGVILCGMLMGGIQGRLYITDPEMVWILRSPWQQLLWFLPVGVFVIMICLIERRPIPRKWIGPGIVAALLLFYCACTGISTYHDGVFCRRSPWDPMGADYAVTDVVRVDAGWRGGFWSVVATTEGQFYYEITFSDGTTEDWSGYASREDGEPFAVLAELDKLLVEQGVGKNVSFEYRELCDPDYVDICDGILRNR